MSPATVGNAISRFIVAAVALAVAHGCTQDTPLPPVAGPATFSGSATCGSCHTDAYDDWLGSHHELAMQHVDAHSVLGNFDNAEFDYFGEQSRFLRRDDSFVVSTPDENGDIAEFEVLYTFGVEPLQQYLVATDGGRLQALPFAWDSRAAADGGQRWFHLYPDEPIRPGDELHWTGMQQNWNFMCAECHSTDLQMAYDHATRSFDTRWSEISVGCEACHGPGSRHVEQAQRGEFSDDFGLPVDLDDRGGASWIMNEQTGIAARSAPLAGNQRQVDACGRCHARRAPIAAEYVYGKPLTDTHMPSLLEAGLYHADGQIDDEVYVYGSFLQSAMYRAGVTCSDCHNPHSLALHTGPEPNAVCAQCHAPAVFGDVSHSGHAAGVATCVDCHMPETTYMVVDDRRDHSFRVPRPDLTEAFGTPNACADCHADRDAGWATAAIAALQGDSRAPHFAGALAAASRGRANSELVALFDDRQMPAIARATAISVLEAPFGDADLAAIRAALAEPDALLRIAALEALRIAAPETRLLLAPPILDDAVFGVRTTAAQALMDVATQLRQGERSRLQAVLDEYRKALLATANRPESLTNLGNLDVLTGNVSAARQWYDEALLLEPRYAVARVNLADLLRTLDDDVAGERLLRDGIALNAGDASLRHSLGLLYVRQARYDEALGELRLAVDLDTTNARYAYVLAVALNSVDSRDAAIAFTRDYLLSDPDDTIMQDLLRSLEQEAASAVPDQP